MMRLGALVVMWLLLLTLPVGAQPVPTRLDLSWSVDGPLANLRITPLPATPMRVDIQGREAIVRFGTALRPIDLGGPLRDLARFVDALDAGFDSLLIIATPDTQPMWQREGDALVLVLRLPERPVDGATAGTDGIVTERAERRLERLRAAVDAQTGRSDIARGRLARLSKDDPTDVETLVQLAALERQIGRPLRASALLARAAALAPDNDEIAVARADLARAQAGFVRMTPDYRVNSAREVRFSTGILAEIPLTDAWRATATFEQMFIDSPNVRRVNGISSPFKGSRQRGAMGLAYRGEDGREIEGQIFANAERVGAGLKMGLASDLARYGLGIEIARPYWDFSESLVVGGTRDAAFIDYARPDIGGLSLRTRLAAYRYNLPGLADGAYSLGFENEIRLPLDTQVRGASLAYVIEGEYPWRIARRDDPQATGESYRPVPLRYREVHALLGGYALDWRRAFDSQWPVLAEFSAGPAYDRYGGRGGPLLGLAVSWLGEGAFEGGLRSSYGRGVGRDSSSFTNIGGYALWRM